MELLRENQIRPAGLPIETIVTEFISNLNSPHSKRAYRQGINCFIEFALNYYNGESSRPLFWEMVEREHVVSWKEWLSSSENTRKKPYAPKTINQRLSALSEYFVFLVGSKDCAIEASPCVAIKKLRDEVLTETNVVTKEQFRDMLMCARNHPKTPEYHVALLLTFFRTGLRQSEIRNLKMDDYLDLGTMRVLRVRAKGGKFITKVLHPEVIEALEDHLERLEQIGRKRGPGLYLFPTPHNSHNPENLERPWNERSIREFFQTYAKRAGISFNVTPHSARATLVTNLLDQKHGIYKVAEEVGHSSVSTTEMYDKRRKRLNETLLKDYDI